MAETNKNVVNKSLGVLGSIDANTGSPDLGWDTDQFPMDIRACTAVMLQVVRQVSALIGDRLNNSLDYSADFTISIEWRPARRIEFRRQNTARIDRFERLVHGSHRRHGFVGARSTQRGRLPLASRWKSEYESNRSFVCIFADTLRFLRIGIGLENS